MIFTKGFEVDGFVFGWHKRELWRLPSKSGLRHYCLKKLQVIRIGNGHGYRLKKKKFTIEQCYNRTKLFIEPLIIETTQENETPF